MKTNLLFILLLISGSTLCAQQKIDLNDLANLFEKGPQAVNGLLGEKDENMWPQIKRYQLEFRKIQCQGLKSVTCRSDGGFLVITDSDYHPFSWQKIPSFEQLGEVKNLDSLLRLLTGAKNEKSAAFVFLFNGNTLELKADVTLRSVSDNKIYVKSAHYSQGRFFLLSCVLTYDMKSFLQNHGTDIMHQPIALSSFNVVVSEKRVLERSQPAKTKP